MFVSLKLDGQRKEDPVQDSRLQEKAIHVGKIQKQFETTSSQVVLENVKASITQHMLILVLETVCGLEDDDFSVERIPEIDVAVVTFVKSIGKTKHTLPVIFTNVLKGSFNSLNQSHQINFEY